MPGGSVRLQFGDRGALDRAAQLMPEGSRDDVALALEIPSDGGVHTLRALLDRLDTVSVEVEALSVRPPDLDDVFLSLTGVRGGEEVPS